MIPQHQPGIENADLERDLTSLPDKVADALLAWRKATIEQEKITAVYYLRFRGDGHKRTVNEIEAMVNTNEECYLAKLDEALKEALYTRLLEKLYSAKKQASFRTAF